MIYKLIYLLWAAASLANLSRLQLLDEKGLALYFGLSVAVLGLTNWVVTRRILRTVKALEPDNYDNIRDFFIDTKKNKELLHSEVPQVQKLIRDYKGMKPYALLLVVLLIFVLIYRMFA